MKPMKCFSCGAKMLPASDLIGHDGHYFLVGEPQGLPENGRITKEVRCSVRTCYKPAVKVGGKWYKWDYERNPENPSWELWNEYNKPAVERKGAKFIGDRVIQ